MPHSASLLAASASLALLLAPGLTPPEGVGGGTGWVETQKLLASDGAAGDEFGISVSVTTGALVVGAYFDDDNGTDSGSAYVFERDAGGTWVETKLLASDGEAGDEFGYAVSISGHDLVVGAWEDDATFIRQGSVYVFRRDPGGAWVETQKLLASDGEEGDIFGGSVSLSGDVLVVGAAGGNGETGAAYVFERDGGGVWVETQQLLASDGQDFDNFGTSVSVTTDVIVVGAPEDDAPGLDSGSAYVFERDGGGTWVETQKLLASDGAASDIFGVSVPTTGDVIVVGAVFDDDNGTDSGSAYVFERDGGGTFVETQKVLASDGAAGDNFGYSVSLSGDALVAGAWAHDDNGTDSGSAYVFERDGGGAWLETQELLASDGAEGDFFGSSVSMTADALAVGTSLGIFHPVRGEVEPRSDSRGLVRAARGHDGNGADAGSAYVFAFQLFSDGFESGDTSAWSSTVP